MNHDYDDDITGLTDILKSDKSIIQPWRNKAIARLEEAQAFIRMGKTTTNLRPPSGTVNDDGSLSVCTCPPGAVDTLCPVHGTGVNTKPV